EPDLGRCGDRSIEGAGRGADAPRGRDEQEEDGERLHPTYFDAIASRNSCISPAGRLSGRAVPVASTISTCGRSGVSSHVSWRSSPCRSALPLSPYRKNSVRANPTERTADASMTRL